MLQRIRIVNYFRYGETQWYNLLLEFDKKQILNAIIWKNWYTRYQEKNIGFQIFGLDLK